MCDTNVNYELYKLILCRYTAKLVCINRGVGKKINSALFFCRNWGKEKTRKVKQWTNVGGQEVDRGHNRIFTPRTGSLLEKKQKLKKKSWNHMGLLFV